MKETHMQLRLGWVGNGGELQRPGLKAGCVVLPPPQSSTPSFLPAAHSTEGGGREQSVPWLVLSCVGFPYRCDSPESGSGVGDCDICLLITQASPQLRTALTLKTH